MCKDLKDKYISVMGDSISTYEGCLPEGYATFYSYQSMAAAGIYGKGDTWWGQVLNYFGARLLVNNSYSGSYVCKPPECQIESYACSDERTGGLHLGDVMPEHIIIFIGTNDRGRGFRQSSEDKGDLTVIENAYSLMLTKIRANYPSAEIWCCTFPITSCPRDPYFEFPAKKWGNPMISYCELVATVAERHGCHVIDLWDENMPCETIDGLHPSYNGMCMIAAKVIKHMEKEGYRAP